MSSIVSEFFLTAMTAIVLENVIFTRALGINKNNIQMNNGNHIILYGGCLTIVSFFSSLLSWVLYGLAKGFPYPEYVKYACFLLSITIVYVLFYCLTRRYSPVLFFRVQKLLPLASFNSAVLGSLYLTVQSNYSVIKSLGFGLGSGIGFTVALLITMECRKKIALSDVPRSFRGLPITLLFIGIFSLAIYGLIGHQLPT